MVVKIMPNEKGLPNGKLADAEVHFTEGALDGLRLLGFAIWERRNGPGRNVTFPSRTYSVNGERRSFSLLRPITDANALGDTLACTLVNDNAQLEISNVAGTIFEDVVVRNIGANSLGALQNIAGDSTWAGDIVLDANTTIGVATGTRLTVSGQISDQNAGHNLTKVGQGRLVLTAANDYQGITTIDNGVLEIRVPKPEQVKPKKIEIGFASAPQTIEGTTAKK